MSYPVNKDFECFHGRVPPAERELFAFIQKELSKLRLFFQKKRFALAKSGKDVSF